MQLHSPHRRRSWNQALRSRPIDLLGESFDGVGGSEDEHVLRVEHVFGDGSECLADSEYTGIEFGGGGWKVGIVKASWDLKGGGGFVDRMRASAWIPEVVFLREDEEILEDLREDLEGQVEEGKTSSLRDDLLRFGFPLCLLLPFPS